jgi:hypothetical protein
MELEQESDHTPYLRLERAFQTMAAGQWDRMGRDPGPFYDVADDLTLILGKDQAADLAEYLEERTEAWEDETR